MQSMACTIERRSTSLFSLPENIIIGILRTLPTKDKCQAELVCRSFRELLSNPTPVDFVWDELHLNDTLFEKVPLKVLNRWLLRRIKGVSTLFYCGHIGGKGNHLATNKAMRDQHIILTLLPLLSGLISAEASGFDLEVTWVRTTDLFAPERPDFVSQYWSSVSTGLTYLTLTIEGEKMTEDMSAVLSQLIQLREFWLQADDDFMLGPEQGAVISLDLPRLWRLKLSDFSPCAVKLKCPELTDLELDDVGVTSFSGMPSRMDEVCVSLLRAATAVLLREMFPAHGAKLLRKLVISHASEEYTDPETVKKLCLNGKLRCLSICCDPFTYDGPMSGGALAFGASWQAVPRTLQHVTLDLPLDKGIPRILEQLRGLRKLHLRHSKACRMHLDRPLDPFLSMPRLSQLKLESWQQGRRVDDTGMCMWTPAALRLLGLAEDRIHMMRRISPKRSFTLIY